jgi:CheY-like chemotaxis protein
MNILYSISKAPLIAAPRPPWIILASSPPSLSRQLGRAIAASTESSVKCVSSGGQLLDLLTRCFMRSRYMGRSAYPDLVIADDKLPGFGGVDVMCGLADAGTRIPFVVMSEDVNPDRTEVERRGGLILAKPCTWAQIVSAAGRVLRTVPAHAATA